MAGESGSEKFTVGSDKVDRKLDNLGKIINNISASKGGIEVGVNTEEAQKQIQKLIDRFGDLGKALQEIQKRSKTVNPFYFEDAQKGLYSLEKLRKEYEAVQSLAKDDKTRISAEARYFKGAAAYKAITGGFNGASKETEDFYNERMSHKDLTRARLSLDAMLFDEKDLKGYFDAIHEAMQAELDEQMKKAMKSFGTQVKSLSTSDEQKARKSRTGFEAHSTEQEDFLDRLNDEEAKAFKNYATSVKNASTSAKEAYEEEKALLKAIEMLTKIRQKNYQAISESLRPRSTMIDGDKKYKNADKNMVGTLYDVDLGGNPSQKKRNAAMLKVFEDSTSEMMSAGSGVTEELRREYDLICQNISKGGDLAGEALTTLIKKAEELGLVFKDGSWLGGITKSADEKKFDLLSDVDKPAVTKFLDTMKKKLGESYEQAQALAEALEMLEKLKRVQSGNGSDEDIADFKDYVTNAKEVFGRGTAGNAILGAVTGKNVSNQTDIDNALKSIDADIFDQVIEEQNHKW